MSDTSNKMSASKKALDKASSTEPSYHELAKGALKDGLVKSAQKSGEQLQTSQPTSKMGVAVHVLRSVGAGAKDYVDAAKYGTIGFLQGVRQQNPNDGLQTQSMVINQKIKQDGQAAKALKGSSSSPVTKDTSKAVSALTNSSSSATKGTGASTSKGSSSGGQSSSSSSSGQSSGGQSR